VEIRLCFEGMYYLYLQDQRVGKEGNTEAKCPFEVLIEVYQTARSYKIVLFVVATVENLKFIVQYYVHKSLPLVTIFSHMNLICALLRVSLRSNLVLSFQLHLGLSSGLFQSGLYTKILYGFLISLRPVYDIVFLIVDLSSDDSLNFGEIKQTCMVSSLSRLTVWQVS
jgi:hypothetical protein